MDAPVSQLYGQIRIGRVSSVDPKRHTAQVQFSEQDGFVSPDLPVLVTRPGDYSLPAENTPVLCLIVDGRLGVGYVLGAIYTESDAAPLDDASKRSVAGDDLRLGAPDASDKVALASLVKDRLDKLQQKFDAHTHDVPYTSPAGPATATAAPTASSVGELDDVAAEKVSAK
jgi:phage baseplate assembly protein gpV